MSICVSEVFNLRQLHSIICAMSSHALLDPRPLDVLDGLYTRDFTPGSAEDLANSDDYLYSASNNPVASVGSSSNHQQLIGASAGTFEYGHDIYTSAPPADGTCLIQKLPTDIILTILDHLDLIQSTCLGLTCKSFHSIHWALHGPVRLGTITVCERFAFLSVWHLYEMIRQWMAPKYQWDEHYETFRLKQNMWTAMPDAVGYWRRRGKKEADVVMG